MIIKAKIGLYIFALAILAFVFGAFGYWYYHYQSGQNFFVNFEQYTPEQKFHRAYSMDGGFYDNFFSNNKPVEKITEPVSAAVVPHHLVAGIYLANFFKAMAGQEPKTVVIIGPNHKQLGSAGIITSPLSWQTPYGVVSVNKKLLSDIIGKELAVTNESVMGANTVFPP